MQVLEYVDDVDAALTELFRVVRSGGRVLVWDVDGSTVSWPSQDPDRTRRVLAAWDTHLAHPALPRTLTAQLRGARFNDVTFHPHVFATAELIPDAYGRAAVGLIGDFVAGRPEIGRTSRPTGWPSSRS